MITRAPTQRKRDTGYLFIPKTWRKSEFLVWLRRTHAWLGLWGAVLGLLFGLTGFLLNHRQVLKIPAAQSLEQQQRIAIPDTAKQTPKAFEHWIRNQTGMQQAKGRIQKIDTMPAPWGNGLVMQPELWKVNLNTLGQSTTAEYWQGNNQAVITQRHFNMWATLNRLHMGAGMGVAWVLLADSLALGLLIMTVTGLLLWSRLHGARILAIGLISTCLISAITLTMLNS
ncbi:MAG: peptidase [Sulfuriferula sp.]|nr:peptidase [Sulfuriferula sp.]